MGRLPLTRNSSSSEGDSNNSSNSKKLKNRLAAAKFRNKQKAQIQDYKSQCEQQEKEILRLNTELKIANERTAELQRMLDISMAYRSLPVTVTFPQMPQTPSQKPMTNAAEVAQVLVQNQQLVAATPFSQDLTNEIPQVHRLNETTIDFQPNMLQSFDESATSSVLSNASTSTFSPDVTISNIDLQGQIVTISSKDGHTITSLSEQSTSTSTSTSNNIVQPELTRPTQIIFEEVNGVNSINNVNPPNGTACYTREQVCDIIRNPLLMNWLCSEGNNFASWFASCIFFGVFTGTIAIAPLGDMLGRKKAAIISLVITMFFNMLLAFAPPNSYLLIAIRFCVGVGIGGKIVVGITLVMEMLLPQQRMPLRTFFNWGRLREMEESERHIARLGGVEYVPINRDNIERSKTFCEVVHAKGLFKRLLILWCMWFVSAVCSYATDFYSNTISGDLFTNQIWFSIFIIISKKLLLIIDTFFPDFKRRTLHQSTQFMIIILFLALFVMKTQDYTGTVFLVINLLGTAFMECCWDANYLCAIESMETSCRTTATGTCSLVARIGAIIAPFLGDIAKIYPPFIYGFVVVIGCVNLIISYLFLVETKGVNLDKVHVDEDPMEELVLLNDKEKI